MRRATPARQQHEQGAQHQPADPQRELCEVKCLNSAFRPISPAHQLQLHRTELRLVLRFEILGEPVKPRILAPRPAQRAGGVDGHVIAQPHVLDTVERVLFLEQHRGQRDQHQKHAQSTSRNQGAKIAHLRHQELVGLVEEIDQELHWVSPSVQTLMFTSIFMKIMFMSSMTPTTAQAGMKTGDCITSS